MIRNRIFPAFSKFREAIARAPLATSIFWATAVLGVGAKIPIPGINTKALTDFFNGGTDNKLLNVFDWFVGGALSRGALLALGIMPYISARIMMRLACEVFPPLARIRAQPGGPERLARWAVRLTFVLGVLQSFGFARFAQTIPGAVATPGPVFVLQTVTALTASAMTIAWLAERARKSRAAVSIEEAEAAEISTTQLDAASEVLSLPAADLTRDPAFLRDKARVHNR